MAYKKLKERNLFPIIGFAAVIMMLVLVLGSCESIFGPSSEDEDSDTDDDAIARIIISNGYGATLDIYMDGTFQFTLTDDDTKKIKDVSIDEHDLEAKLPGTATVVDSETVDVTDTTDYTWAIGDPPDINVLNKYGTTLKIFMDGTYLFDLADDEDRWIMNVTFGEHFLRALRLDTGAEVASTTIDVEANKDYAWTIN